MSRRSVKWVLAAMAIQLSGCGLEAIINDSLEGENEPPRSKVSGELPVEQVELSVLGSDGSEIEVQESLFNGRAFQLNLPSTSYQNLRIEASAGNITWSTIVPRLDAESEVEGVIISEQTTFVVKIIDATLTARESTLQSFDSDAVDLAIRSTLGNLNDGGVTEQAWTQFQRLFAAGDLTIGPPLLFNPFFAMTIDDEGGFVTVDSVINPDFLTIYSVDYNSDGTRDVTTDAFDGVFEAAAEANELVECLDPENLRVVFEVDLNAGRLDDNCSEINRFRWARDRPGKRMFFVGGVHEESPIQDTVIDASLGNQGSWVPNSVPMFDDGTNGDAVAGDNIWSISYVLPRGLRVGYKYTWGFQGDLWGGTEEWPGNQHILEVEDINEDGFVRRRDEFGDETTNKDLANANQRGGAVSWETDLDDNGIPDARERPIDFDNDCSLDDWETPTAIGPAVVDCALLE